MAGAACTDVNNAPEKSLPVNLLSDADFPHGSSVWFTRSWRDGFRPLNAEKVLGNFSNGIACIDVDTPDDTLLLQQVRVKLHRHYKLSGSIKTEDVQITQEGGATGACLSVWDTAESSQSVSGTSDWTEVECLFDSGASSVCEVGPRLGQHGSIARGKAWFKDLKLIEY